jgi:uncharacterized membrane protein YozB (DUF420 family)
MGEEAPIIAESLAYWTWAFANLLFAVSFGIAGVRRVRRRRVRGHRRMMLAGVSLVGLFLVSYLVKVALLGREDRSSWSQATLCALYVHEACVVAMLVAAGIALTRARRFGPLRDGEPPAPEASERDRRVHRRAGRVAVAASVLALLTAAAVLAGMYARAVA